LWAVQDALQSLEAVERKGCLLTHDGGARSSGSLTDNGHDRRNLPEGTPHSIQFAGKKGDLGRTNGGMNTMTAGQVSDYTGAAALLDDLPEGHWLLGDRCYDTD